MANTVIKPSNVHETVGYSHAIVAGNTVYAAGQTARAADGSLVGPGDVEAQTVQVMENLRDVLEAAGAHLSDVTKVTVYTTDLAYRSTIGAVRSRYFGDPPPASTFVVISSLADPDFLVEIEAIAVIG